MPSELIFVTGASGFLGSHVVQLLLDGGYRVRAAARGSKVKQLKQSYAKYGDQLEVIAIADISVDKFPEALQGVDAVIHTAAPLPSRAEPDVILKGAIEGSTNLIHQAYEAGIRCFVVTSSIVSVLNNRNSFTDKDWNPITKEHAVGAWASYVFAKTEAERALWKFADEHPDAEITTLNPPYLYGPFAPGFTIPEPDIQALSTNAYIYRILTPEGVYPDKPGYADIRDIARAHVGALTSPPTSVVGRKRILINGDVLNYKDVAPLLEKERPALKGRVLPSEKAPEFPIYRIPFDAKRVEEITGVKTDSYKTWKETILDTVDSLLAIEEQWKSKGYTVSKA